jgi:hypothetical protein
VKKRRVNVNPDQRFSSEDIAFFEACTHIKIQDPRVTKKDRKSGLYVTREKSPEASLKSKITKLGSFYKQVSRRLRYPIEYLGWDPKLCKKFLASKPTLTQLMIAIMGPRLEWIYSGRISGQRNRFIGYVISAKNGVSWSRRDSNTYIELLKSETEKRNEFMKLVIKKSKQRQRRTKKNNKKTPVLPYLTITC